MATRPDGGTDSIEAMIAAMKQAADSLADAAGTSGRVTPDPPSPSPAAQSSETARYHQHLQERGALVDVDDTTDLAKLPPNITHVRLPNGQIRRLGYS